MSTTNNDTIRWENFVKFVRQLSHDLRNQLNAAELQAALIGEITHEAELKPELLRLRELVSHLGTALQQLSTAVAPPHPTQLAYAAKDLVADVQKKIAQDFPEQSQRVKWDTASVNGTMLNIDPGLIITAAVELLENAFRHADQGEIAARASEQGNRFEFVVTERAKRELDPVAWEEPLREVKHGHYGLGLRRARAITAAHGGELKAEFDAGSSMLTSKLVLPCASAAEEIAGKSRS